MGGGLQKVCTPVLPFVYLTHTITGYTTRLIPPDLLPALWPSMVFFILLGVSGRLVLSGLTGHLPWNDIATLYFNQSKADITPMHQSLLLLSQLHNLLRYDYCMIYMKNYSWIPIERKVALYTLCVMFCRCHLCWLLINQIYIDPEFTITASQRFEILPQQIWDKVWACLATRFNVQKPVVLSSWIRKLLSMAKSVVLKEMMSWLAVILLKRARTARMHPSFKLSLVFLLFLQSLTILLQYTLYVDWYARHRRRTPAFEEKTFFGQLKHILVLELPAAPQLDLVEPMTLILVLI